MVGKATLLVSGNDSDVLKSQPEVRFMNLFNFKPVDTGSGKNFAGQIVEDSGHHSKAPILQWVPSTDNDNVAVQVLMPDGTQVNGFAEADLQKEGVDSIIQFVRFGFCRIDRNSSKLVTACFAHQ
jgi:glutamyl-tRNA synthetase